MAACHSPRSAAPAPTLFNREVQDLFLAFHETTNTDKITETVVTKIRNYKLLFLFKIIKGPRNTITWQSNKLENWKVYSSYTGLKLSISLLDTV